MAVECGMNAEFFDHRSCLAVLLTDFHAILKKGRANKGMSGSKTKMVDAVRNISRDLNYKRPFHLITAQIVSASSLNTAAMKLVYAPKYMKTVVHPMWIKILECLVKESKEAEEKERRLRHDLSAKMYDAISTNMA